jgi:hypothetical protein
MMMLAVIVLVLVVVVLVDVIASLDIYVFSGHSRLSQYTEMARAVHGPEYDPSAHDFDGEIVMRVGGGKKHGRYWMGDGVIDTSSTPTLSQIRARSTSASPAIRPRPTTASHLVNELQVISVLFVAY